MVLDNFNTKEKEIIKKLLELRRLSNNLKENLNPIKEIISILDLDENKEIIKNILNKYSNKKIPNYNQYRNLLSKLKLDILNLWGYANLKVKPKEKKSLTKKIFSLFKKDSTSRILSMIIIISSIGASVMEIQEISPDQNSLNTTQRLEQIKK